MPALYRPCSRLRQVQPANSQRADALSSLPQLLAQLSSSSSHARNVCRWRVQSILSSCRRTASHAGEQLLPAWLGRGRSGGGSASAAQRRQQFAEVVKGQCQNGSFALISCPRNPTRVSRFLQKATVPGSLSTCLQIFPADQISFLKFACRRRKLRCIFRLLKAGGRLGSLPIQRTAS